MLKKTTKSTSSKLKSTNIDLTDKPGLVFTSEELLQQAIIGLLKRLPDHTGIQQLQGTQELGKDVIFYAKGGLGESVLCACVIKNKKITGNVSTSGGARTVLFQAEQALDSAHVDSAGNDVRVENVYVITPFDLPPETVASIKGRLKERSGRVKFFGGSALFDLFRKHWPDFIADEAAVLEHIRETKSKIVGESKLRRLAFQYATVSVSPKLEKVYVIQDFHRELPSFSLGEVFTSLPSARLLNGKISESLLINIQNAFHSFDEGLRYLNQWDLCPEPADTRNNQSVAKFARDLTTSWKQQVLAAKKQDARNRQQKYRGAAFDDDEDNTVGAIAISDAKMFEARFKELVQDRVRSLRVVNERLKLLKEISATKFSGFTSLSNESFLKACHMYDCIRSSPEGLFLRQSRVERFEYPKNILDGWGRSLFIAGAPGYGKTTFCRRRALQDTERFATGKSSIIPVYIALHTLSQQELGTFEDTFLAGKGQSALVGNLDEDAKSRVRLYLDGLDEISSEERRIAITNLAREGAEGNPNIQIVMTARDYITGPWLSWLPRVNISPFSDAQIKEFVDKWFGKGTEINHQFRQQLAGLPTIRDLIRTPLLATLTCIVFMQLQRLPENRIRLYEIFIELLSGGWDTVKEVQRNSRFGPRVKVAVLTALAATLHKNKKREFSASDLSVATKTIFLAATERDCRALGDELLVDGIVNANGRVLQFAHLSFQEFLTAKDFMGRASSDRAFKALGQYLSGNNWWRDVLKFYIGLSSSPKDICEWLARGIVHFRTKSGEASVPSALELVASLAESLPGFPVEELALKLRGPLDYQTTLRFLRKRKAND